jgi:UDP-N-acetylglucosamine transferase subunit ALG13
MVKVVDAWAKANPSQQIVAQVARLGQSAYVPQYLEWREFYPERELNQLIDQSDFIVSHAGMGSIMNALSRRKPIVVMPRLSQLGEHRNDHQVDTVNRFRNLSGVTVADDEETLARILTAYDDRSWKPDVSGIPASADEKLINAIQRFISER